MAAAANLRIEFSVPNFQRSQNEALGKHTRRYDNQKLELKLIYLQQKVKGKTAYLTESVA